MQVENLVASGGAKGKEVVARNAAQYLALKREYKGLETPLTGAPVIDPARVVQGRAGRAAVYEDEPSQGAA